MDRGEEAMQTAALTTVRGDSHGRQRHQNDNDDERLRAHAQILTRGG